MNPNSSNMCIRYSVWVIEGKYTHNLPIYLLYIIYNKIGANWCKNHKRVISALIMYNNSKSVRSLPKKRYFSPKKLHFWRKVLTF